MAAKDERQAAILSLVEDGPVDTQALIIKELTRQSIKVDQSTLSRDLTELGIRKRGGRYRVTEKISPSAGGVDYSAAVRRFVVCGPNLIVVSTDVGQAQPVALAIEQAEDPSVVATLAGDDTIFVATKNQRTQSVALRRLAMWFGEKHER